MLIWYAHYKDHESSLGSSLLHCCCRCRDPEAPPDHPHFLTLLQHNRSLGAIAGWGTLIGRTLDLTLCWQTWVPSFGFLALVSPDFLSSIVNSHNAHKTFLPAFKRHLVLGIFVVLEIFLGSGVGFSHSFALSRMFPVLGRRRKKSGLRKEEWIFIWQYNFFI